MYVKRLELSYFKSFGSTTSIPLLPGFTVVSGPNGSGKSNLLDAMLFALGLSGSKGMRAERLPDLVNQAQLKRGHAIIETRVTVTFDLGEIYIPDDQLSEEDRLAREWQVTRKLRVTKQGTYTSTYAINGEVCTLTQLHDELNRQRVYPEGYNIVLQGDVTSIISMNARQRREIIDELAGVASFDRKINQARDKLDSVKEQEDRFRIVEQELQEQCERLDRDRVKAQKYQALRTEFQEKSIWEKVLTYRHIEQQIVQLQQQAATEQARKSDLEQQIQAIATDIQQKTTALHQLNLQVKSLGEDEQLAVQGAIATQEAELRQLQRQEAELASSQQQAIGRLDQVQQQQQHTQATLTTLTQQQHTLETQTLQTLTAQRNQTQKDLDGIRNRSQAIATAAESWIQEQSQLRQQVEACLATLDPQRSEMAQLRERVEQQGRQQAAQQSEVQTLAQEKVDLQQQLQIAQADLQQQQVQVQEAAIRLAEADQTLSTTRDTQARLLREQQEKQRQLDKLEATEQAQQEAQGTLATRLLMKANLTGICGLVANLGRVEPDYQLALETAAGGRMGHLVVEDDGVAAAGIELLKRERGGRATFLPLNKLRSPLTLPPLNVAGALDYALYLIDFAPKYEAVFAYVFGNTVVFESLEAARRHLGRYRMVTLDGELLEPTGAMTGGSRGNQRTLHFGNVEAGESAEVLSLRQRLSEIERLLNRIDQQLGQQQQAQADATQRLTLLRQQHRDRQFQVEQLHRDLQGVTQRHDPLLHQMSSSEQELAIARDRLLTLETELPSQEAALAELRAALAELEQSQTHGEWKQIQAQIQAQEAVLRERESALTAAQRQAQELILQQQRCQEKIAQAEAELTQVQQSQVTYTQQTGAVQAQQQQVQAQIAALQVELQQLDARMGEAKATRDRAEQALRAQTTAQQELNWTLEKLHEAQQQRQEQRNHLTLQLQQQRQELPQPQPDLPNDITLETLREALRSLQRRIEAMEPVNMLAIEEYERTQTRLSELMAKLSTLEEERTELLLRIENFTTLRQNAFREAFDAVNENFKSTFADLSDGDGYLELEDPEDPFRAGLNLVAHPKGKQVQRLASMSGGEKSLTALSFIFALQRYRPSPFYAFDEVDSFLDGINVERLAKTIRQQADNAQFIVVSHRRPMIEAADRTIGVTQARGTHTQVIGIKLRPEATEAVAPPS